ncbi:MAG: hypothetical protein ACRBFS_24450 [Aureispira sp.]
MSKNLIVGGGLVAALYLYSSDQKQERFFMVNGKSVPESQLPSLGYTYLDGKWWPDSTIQQAAQQGGVSIPGTKPGSSQQGDVVWAVIGGVLATGMQMIPLFQDLLKKKDK